MVEQLSSKRSFVRRLAAGCVVVSLLGGLASAGGCGGTVQTFPLSIPGADGARYFASLQTCSTQAQLSSRETMHGVYVTFDARTELQFVVQGASFDLVVWVDGSVPEQDVAKVQQAGKAKGDELFACAQKLGPSEAPTSATGEPTSTPTTDPLGEPTNAPTATPTTAPTTTPTSAPTSKPSATATAATQMQIKKLAPIACATSKKKCQAQSDCDLTERCAGGACYTPTDGCPCNDDAGCPQPGSHCGKGVCYPNALGAVCDDDGNAMECGLGTGLHCAKGLCYPNKTGAPCKEDMECTVGPEATGSTACVQGVCN